MPGARGATWTWVRRCRECRVRWMPPVRAELRHPTDMELINEDSPRRSLANVRVGANVRFFNFVNAYGCEIGDNTKVGSFVEIQKGARIGRNCKVSSHSFVCEGVEIGDEVFIG